MPQRVLNWDVKLVEWGTGMRGLPFRWGETDCVSLVRAACRVLYDEELWPGIQYDTEEAALRALKRYGSVKEQLQLLDAIPIGLPFCQTGDVIVGPKTAEERFDSASVVVGHVFLVTMHDAVIVDAPLWAAPEQAVGYRLPHAW